MSDLTKLPHGLDSEARTCRAVIEASRRGVVKYKYDPTLQAFTLKSMLPAGMAYPLDFGFVPSTMGEDADPLDVHVLFEEPLMIGAVVAVRLIGVIEADQTEQGKTFRNDRLVAVAAESRQFGQLAALQDLEAARLGQLEAFWVQMNALKGKQFKVRGVGDAAAAVKIIQEGARTG